MDNWSGNIVLLSGCSANCYIRAACVVTDSLRLLELDRKARYLPPTPPPTPPSVPYHRVPYHPKRIQEQRQEKKRDRDVVGEIIQSMGKKRNVVHDEEMYQERDEDAYQEEDKDAYQEEDICYDGLF